MIHRAISVLDFGLLADLFGNELTGISKDKIEDHHSRLRLRRPIKCYITSAAS